MNPELEAKLAQRVILEAQINAYAQLGNLATPAQAALLKAYRRMLLALNAQIVILEATPAEPPPEEG